MALQSLQSGQISIRLRVHLACSLSLTTTLYETSSQFSIVPPRRNFTPGCSALMPHPRDRRGANRIHAHLHADSHHHPRPDSHPHAAHHHYPTATDRGHNDDH